MPAAELGARQVLVGRHCVLHCRLHRALGRRQSPSTAIAGVALLVAPHFIGVLQPPSHDSPIPETLHHSSAVAAASTTQPLFAVLLGGLHSLFPAAVGRHCLTMEERHTAGRARRTLALGGVCSAKSSCATDPRHGDAAAVGVHRHGASAGRRDERAHCQAQSRSGQWLVDDRGADRACPRRGRSAATSTARHRLHHLLAFQFDARCARCRLRRGRFVRSLDERKAPTFVVSCEVGGGLVPETPLGRAFRDEAGLVNQQLAVSAHQVLLMVAGLAMPLKVLP